MRAESTLSDRRQLVKILEQRTGGRAEYQGAPTFTYKIGDIEVLRDGSIVFDEAAIDMQMIGTLICEGFIRDTDRDVDDLVIRMPMDGHDPRSLKNLIFMIHARQRLIDQAIGRPKGFFIRDDQIKSLQEEEPFNIRGMIAILDEDAMRGLWFNEREIIFRGFPLAKDPTENRAYIELASLMAAEAKRARWIDPKEIRTENPKYSFRVWLVRLGMKGDRYKASRKALLARLSGHSAFRTKSQAETAMQKTRAARQEVKELADGFSYSLYPRKKG